MVSFIPNLITILRIAATPVLILLLRYGAFESALLLFLVAGVSDALDGYIAKRYQAETQLGAILDPIADKLLLVSCFVMLTLLQHLPFWLLVVVAFRDVLIVGGYMILVLLNVPVKMQPSAISKVNTLCQICLVGFVLAQLAGIVPSSFLLEILIGLVASTTVLSGIHYVWVWGFGKQGIAGS